MYGESFTVRNIYIIIFYQEGGGLQKLWGVTFFCCPEGGITFHSTKNLTSVDRSAGNVPPFSQKFN